MYRREAGSGVDDALAPCRRPLAHSGYVRRSTRRPRGPSPRYQCPATRLDQPQCRLPLPKNDIQEGNKTDSNQHNSRRDRGLSSKLHHLLVLTPPTPSAPLTPLATRPRVSPHRPPSPHGSPPASRRTSSSSAGEPPAGLLSQSRM